MSEAELPYFEGHQPRDCGEHRTVGSHRAWCFDCHEWCYPTAGMGCVRCEAPRERALADVLKRTIDKVNELLVAERALADDLAAALNKTAIGPDGELKPPAADALARYREVRGR